MISHFWRISSHPSGVVILFLSGVLMLADPCWAAAKNNEPGLGVYEVIVKKNLFDPLRGEGVQNQTDEKAKYASEQDLIKRYEVYGTSIAGGRRQAFIKGSSSVPPPGMISGPPRPVANPDRPQTVAIGDSIEGWHVIGITSSGIDLELNRRRVHLAIFGPEKNERKATGPVGLQTPQLRPETPPPAQPEGASDNAQNAQPKGGETAQPPINPQVNPQVNNPQPTMPPQIVHPLPTPTPVQPPLSVPGSSLRDLLLHPNH